MRKSEVVLSLALAVSVSLSLWLWRELRLVHEQHTLLEMQPQAASAAPIETRPPDITAASPAATVAATTPATSPVAPAAAQASAKKPGPSLDEQQAAQLRLLQDPRYRAAYREQSRLNYGLRRENIIRLVGLTPEQADAVIGLQVDRELGWIEDPKSLNENYEANEREHQAKLREMLGEEKFARLQQYMESRSSRMQVDQLRNHLGGPDMLRDDQVEPLIAALHPEITQLRRDLKESERTAMWSSNTAEAWRQHAERRVELEKDAHSRMHVAAAPILSQTQLEKFDAMLARELGRRAAEQRMQGLQAKIGGANNPDGAN